MAQPYPQKEETHEREFASYMIILGVVGFVNSLVEKKYHLWE